MILSWLAPIGAFLKRVPWQVWCGIAVVLACWVWGNYREAQGRADERAEIAAELAQAEKEAVRESLEAAAKADTEAAIAAEEEAAVIAEQINRIEDAEAAGRNSLDELF